MRGHAEAAPAETTPPGTRAPRMTLAPWRQWAREGLAAAFARRDARVLACQAVFALLALAALLRLALILRGWPSLDSDEAVVGLMARHILHNGEYPDFFWGQFYLGPLQAYAAAALFAVFGASLVALRLPALLFTLGALAGVYALGRAAYGRAVGLLALAWLALGPPYALIRQIVADGGHQEMLLLAAMVLLGVWDRLRRPEPDTHNGDLPPRSESSLNP
ncbi:MAG TPA: glycosyltransferase family 39 protein, partial [Ktedonobacterales bacterium]|nr:glycosyltransferase family 39 protein [Ktedonobacterales bacterium]